LEKRKMGYFVAPFILDLYHFRCVCNSLYSYEGMMPMKELLKISSIQTKLSLLFLSMGFKGDMRRKVLKNHCCYHRLPIIAISDKFADTSFEVE
jgi:hypothetical protein